MTSLILSLALFALLLCLSGFFSGAETAFFSLSRARVRRIRDTGGRLGQRIATLLHRPRRLLITIIIANICVNVIFSSMMTYTVTQRFGAKAVPFVIPCIAVLLLLFGEVMPKTYAFLRPELCARIAAYPLHICTYIFAPLRIVFRYATRVILAVLRQGHVHSDAVLTREEFHATLHVGTRHGGIAPDEAALIHAISDYCTTSAREIMVPRNDMVCVEEHMPLRDVLTLARKTGYASLPVYAHNNDHIHHILQVKGILTLPEDDLRTLRVCDLLTSQDTPTQSPHITPLRLAFLVPENIHINALLYDMNARTENHAILLDEYGGTAGMVSRKMIVDMLVGGLLDEAAGNMRIHLRANGDIIASGRARIRQINWECGIHLPDDKDDTLSGYIMRLMGRVPSPHDYCNDGVYGFRVLQMNGNKIDAARIRPLTQMET